MPTAVSLGPGCLLLDANAVYEQLKPFGLTKRGFTQLRLALGIPAIHMPNGTVLVDFLSFKLALRVALRVGADDFYVSGHPQIKRGTVPNHGTTKMTKTDWEENWRQALIDMLIARRTDVGFDKPETFQAFSLAAARVGATLDRLYQDELQVLRGREIPKITADEKLVTDAIAGDNGHRADAG